MVERIQEVVTSAVQEIESCPDLGVLDDIRVKYLGRKGSLTLILRAIGDLPADERPRVGKAAGLAKRRLTEALQTRKTVLEKATSPRAVFLDTTLPGWGHPLGKRHPLTLVTEEIVEIFHGMGFAVAEGPEVESDYYNFEALNIPPDHPARDDHDTFYLDNGMLLRTQTSPVQIRTMERTSPPVRVICPGRCFRNDTPDATHAPVFHQVEGLYVDRNVTLGDLKGVWACFVRQMFGKDMKVRFRPDFFPFTEPSVECALSCVSCGGRGCRVCTYTGWLEIAGAGMVDPAVFEYVGYDPEVYSGYAFGMGIERLAMLKYGIQDIRLFLENDLRFIGQF